MPIGNSVFWVTVHWILSHTCWCCFPLTQHFKRSLYWKSEDDVGIAGLGGETEAHPYVSFTINFV